MSKLLYIKTQISYYYFNIFFAQISLFICFVFGLKVVNRATEKLENPCKLKLVFLNRKSLERVGIKTVKFVIFL